MSASSTALATHPPHPLYPHYQNYQSPAAAWRPSAYTSNPSSSSATSQLKRSYNDLDVKQDSYSPNMSSSSSRAQRKADWNEFYRHGIPKEVIVIDDDESDQPAQKIQISSSKSTAVESTLHADKRRKTDVSTRYDPVPRNAQNPQNPQPTRKPHQSSDSSSGDASVRTTSAIYSTAPTSMTSIASQHSNANSRVQKLDDSRAGQKRKRPARKTADEESPERAIITQDHAWSNYVPPPKPPIKANDVYVAVIRDKTSVSNQKIDDEDGHYIVVANTDLTERYTIIKLLGQGTFGKVVEAYDHKKKIKCAVKIIRAVPKYRDASRIELRVLATLASNDKYNKNRCIHLRDCFDVRNHICIVTDLLGSSVFDFLKNNHFVPFPSTHIQSFARQLFTSVAFLHDLNLIHTDLKPENILLVRSIYQTFTYNRNVPSASRNPSSRNPPKLRRVLLDPEIRLIDFGSATFDDEYHSSVVSTRHYRAPEIILNLGWSFPCDIWSIGCILVEFFTGDALFQTHDNLEHLAMMEAVCNAKVDPEMIQQTRKGKGNNKNAAAQYFLPRALRLDYPSNETPKQSRKYVKAMKTFEEIIPSTTDFNRKFLDLLRRVFVFDPKRRITAKQALQHPWFKETLQDDGTEALKIRIGKEQASRENQFR